MGALIHRRPRRVNEIVQGVIAPNPRQNARAKRSAFLGQVPDAGLTYPHAHRPVVGENRWLRFLYRGHRGYLRRAAWAILRFTRTAANFAADFERPPRRPILDRYLVTSEGTDSTYRKPLLSSRHALTPEIFASYSPRLRWLRIEGERRITQRALILGGLVTSGAGTKDLHLPQEAEMSLSKG
jgi:hypothetical protein